jgi:GNAT superfamily N-acetyltransferase
VVLVTLVVRRESRRRGWGRRLVEALVHHHGGRPLKVPAILPEGTADGFLHRVGFVPSEVRQYEMELALP